MTSVIASFGVNIENWTRFHSLSREFSLYWTVGQREAKTAQNPNFDRKFSISLATQSDDYKLDNMFFFNFGGLKWSISTINLISNIKFYTNL